jgi:fibronectin-binding autotransporter adhesin
LTTGSAVRQNPDLTFRGQSQVTYYVKSTPPVSNPDPYAKRFHRRIDLLLAIIAIVLFVVVFSASVRGQTVSSPTASSSTDSAQAKPTPKPSPTPVAPPGDPDWTGATSTTWSVSTNWSPNATPAPTDIVRFTGTFTNQPNLTASASAGGLWMTGTLGQNVTLSLSAGTALTINGTTINGTGGLGILVDNTDTRTLTISAPITLGAAETWRNSSGNVFTVSGAVNTNAKALTIDGTGDTTISGSIGGSGTVTLSGSGVVTFSNTGSTYTGQLTVQSGTLSIDTANASSAAGELGNSSASVILGGSGTTGTLEYTGTGASPSTSKKFTMATGGAGVFQIDNSGTSLTLSGLINGSGTMTKNGAGTLILVGNNTYSGGTIINQGTIELSTNTSTSRLGTGGLTLNGTSTLDLRGVSTAIDSLDGDAGTTITNNFSGAGQTLSIGNSDGGGVFQGTLQNGSGGLVLTKNGAGVIELSGTNTYTGITTISNGMLALGNPGGTNLGLPGGIGTTGGTSHLRLDGGVIGASGTFSRGLGASSVTTVDLGLSTGSHSGFAGFGTTAGFNAANNLTVNLGGSSVAVTWGNNSGGTGGTANFLGSGDTLALGNAGANGTVTFQNPLSLNTNTSGNTSRTVQVDRSTVAGTNDIDAILSGVISGGNDLIKTGAGTLQLSNTNTYGGATTINAGILNAAVFANGLSNSSLGSSSNVAANLIFGGGTLQYTGSTAASTDRLFTIGDTSGNTATLDASGSGVGTLSFTNGGAIAFGNTSAHTLNLTGTNTGINTLSASIGNNTGATSLTKSGGGTWVLSGNSTYTGGTIVSQGLLQLSSSTALGSTSGQLTVNGGVLNLNGQTIGVGNLTGSGGNIWNNGPSGQVTFTIGNGNGTGGNYQGAIADNNGAGTGTVALTKTGTGTITLSAANTYTGNTTVSGGSLFINGSTASGSAVTVNGSGTILGGNGTIAGSVTVNAGANLSPGASANTIAQVSTGALTLNSSSNLNIGITGAGGTGNAGSTYDQVSVTGSITVANLAANLVVAASGLTAANVNQAFYIVANDGADPVNGAFAQTTITSGSDVFSIDYTADATTGALLGGNDIALILVAVPEPGTWAVSGLAAAMLIAQIIRAVAFDKRTASNRTSTQRRS